jgi:hypothetical protein
MSRTTQATRVLLLSTTTGYQLRSFGEAAERCGVELLFATDRCHALDDPWQDAAIPVRFHEEEASLRAILETASTRPVNGLIAVGDRPVVLAARAAEALGVPGNPPSAAAASANKLIARQRFADAGLGVPWFMVVATGVHPEVTARRVTYPAVLKPLGLSGSRGVIRVDAPDEFVRAWRRLRALLARREIRALRQGAEGEILIEGFIAGREYAVEGVVTAGVFTPFAIFDKPDPLDGPYFEETIYVTPSALPAEEQARVVEAVAQGVSALGLRHGPVHGECRVGPAGVVLLEVAARPIGGLCSRVLRLGGQPPFCPGKKGTATVSEPVPEKGDSQLFLEDVLLWHALGHDLSGIRRESGGAAVMMIPIPRRGVFKGVEGIDEARAVRGIDDIRITAKIDQVLEPLPEAGSYLGFIFARGPGARDAELAVREAHERLRFRIDPAIDLAVGS